jgi:hypothetical protein
MPIILATWEAEIRRISVPGYRGKNVFEVPISMDKNWSWV